MADNDIVIFEQHRATLKALAYRMLGDIASAEDVVQEAWIRWQRREVEVANPRSYLLTVAAHLCMNEISSARARHEELRPSLPEPIELDETDAALEVMEQVSMAFLVALQRLSPAERAVLLLHEVFDLSHAEIGALLHKTAMASRQILKRARGEIAEQRSVTLASRDDHQRMLRAFTAAARGGDLGALTELLAQDAVLITDEGRSGVRSGRIRNLRPVTGAKKIATFVTNPKNLVGGADVQAWRDGREYTLNGQPALVAFRAGEPVAALFLSIADGKIVQILIQADRARLRRIHRLAS